MNAPRSMEPDAPCGLCHDNTGYEWDAEVQEWRSVCCGWTPERLDMENDV